MLSGVFLSSIFLLLTYLISVRLVLGQDCECVPYYLCPDGRIITDGSELLDVRSQTCPGVEVCCLPADENRSSSTELPIDINNPTEPNIPVTEVPTQVLPVPNLQIPRVSEGGGCGRRRFPPRQFTDLRVTGSEAGPQLTFYGEAPWMVALIVQKDKPTFKCGGSLITTNAVLTAAHCVSDVRREDLLIRLGEYDSRFDNKPIPSQSARVKEIRSHPEFNPSNLYNDIAVLILEDTINTNAVVDIICAPKPNEEVVRNACYVTGWGRNSTGTGGSYQNILSKVYLDLRDRPYCQNLLRTSRLGKRFILNERFICAGGGDSRDTCTGDGGGPIVCPTEGDPNKLVQMGIVAWGIGCGEGYPTVFTSISYFLPWIQNQVS